MLPSIKEGFYSGRTVSGISAYSYTGSHQDLSLGSWEQFTDLVGSGREERGHMGVTTCGPAVTVWCTGELGMPAHSLFGSGHIKNGA